MLGWIDLREERRGEDLGVSPSCDVTVLAQAVPSPAADSPVNNSGRRNRNTHETPGRRHVVRGCLWCGVVWCGVVVYP